MKILNIAVVGCGAIGPIHIEAINQNPHAKLYAICDIDEDKAKKIAERADCKYYLDFEKMLTDEKIDVVHICTPHYLHFPMICRCLEKRKACFHRKTIGYE